MLWLLFFALEMAASPIATRGRVVDAITGKGVSGVHVTTERIARPGLEEAVTDADGNFAFPAAWNGKLSLGGGYGFTYEREGYRNMARDEVVGYADGSRPGSYLSNGVEVTAPVMHMMMPFAVLSGTVVDERDRPLEHARIIFQPAERPIGFPHEAMTDEKGTFTTQIDAVPLEMTVVDPRGGGDLLPGNPPRRRYLEVRPIQLGPGERRNIRFVLAAAPTYTVSGIVRNHVPAAGHYIGIAFDPDVAAASLPESGGAFSVDGVPPGKYKIVTTLQDSVGACDTCGDGKVSEVHQIINVPRGGLKGVQIDIYAGTEVNVTFAWDGPPPPRPRVPVLYLLDSEGIRYAGQGNPLPISRVQPGEYALSTRDKRIEDFYIRGARLNGQPVPVEAIPIRADMQSASLEVILSQQRAKCQVKVVDSDHHALSLYTVVLLQKRGDGYALVDSLSAVPPGSYLLLALTPALPEIAYTPEILARYVDRATAVTLSAGDVLQTEVVAIEAHPFATGAR